MATIVNIPLVGSLSYLPFDAVFSTAGREFRLPSKYVFGLATIGGIVVFKKLFRFAKNRVSRLLKRERKALTRRDGPEDFEDRTAIITGADGLMGQGYAKELAARNFNLIIVGADFDKLEALATEIQTKIGVVAVPVATDICDTMNMDGFRDKLMQYTQFKHIQVCVNAERARPPKSLGFAEMDFNEIKTQIAKHAIVPLITTQVAIQNMKENNTTGKKDVGVIINSTSGLVTAPQRGVPVYAGAHAFTDYFTQSIANSYRKQGIYISSVRQMCFANADEAAYIQQAKDTLREVFLDRQIHGGLVNTVKANVFESVISNIKG